MCGRYALTTPPSVLAALYRAAWTIEHRPRCNAAPTQVLPVIVARSDGVREVVPMRWGLVPSWAKDPAIGSRMINARCETASEKPAFRSAFRKRRCIVPASGFYEWRKPTPKSGQKTKQPYYIHRADGQPLALAGLWESWRDRESDAEVRTFTILTTDANDVVRDLHDRMPAILEPEACDRWLDQAEVNDETMCELLEPAADGVLEMHPVSTRVNRPSVDEPSLLEPVRAEVEESGDGLFGTL